MMFWGMGLTALAGLGMSARWNWWRPRATGLPILMYHKIGRAPRGSSLKKLWVSPEQLRWQVGWLKSQGYQSLTLRQVGEALREGTPLPPRSVALTFDDGYENNFSQAFPILREAGLTATVFVVVSTVGQDNAWHNPAQEPRLPMMSWEQLRELRLAGWEVASHTLTHARLGRLSESDRRRELVGSLEQLSKELGTDVLSFAYPYGQGQDDPQVQAAVRQAGYLTACSVHQGLAHMEKNPYQLSRLLIRGDDTRWDFMLNLSRGRSRF